MSYLDERRNQKMFGKPVEQKKRYTIPKKSAKKIASEKAEREERAGSETELEKWFKDRRKEMSGTCKCGCGKPSSKKDDKLFSFSCCHIFPKAKFPSVKTHPLNFIELAFWGGCHTNMDNLSVEKWPNMDCWEEMKEKILVLEKLLTEKERSSKFCTKLMELVRKF